MKGVTILTLQVMDKQNRCTKQLRLFPFDIWFGIYWEETEANILNFL